METVNNSNRADEIMRESARLFRRKGFSSTSIRNIGDSMGVTSAALYYHFKNKDEVLFGIMHQGIRYVIDAVETVIAGEELPLDQLKAAVRAHVSVSLENQDFAAVLLQDLRHLSAESRSQMVQERDSYETIWADLLKRCADRGAIAPDTDLHLLRLMIFGTLNLIVTWYRPEGERSPQEIADTYYRYIFNGVLEVQDECA